MANIINLGASASGGGTRHCGQITGTVASAGGTFLTLNGTGFVDLFGYVTYASAELQITVDGTNNRITTSDTGLSIFQLVGGSSSIKSSLGIVFKDGSSTIFKLAYHNKGARIYFNESITMSIDGKFDYRVDYDYIS